MNELIIELADKAVEDISSGPWNISDEFCIKFAELIIRECISELSDTFDMTIEEGNHLKEHFGLEEE